VTYLTTAQAAMFFGVSEVTIRQWKMLGHLTPINPRKRPSLYRESDLWRRKADLKPSAEHARLDAAWTQIQREG
jgi:DNA-binding transcriptional MerR regulator